MNTDTVRLNVTLPKYLVMRLNEIAGPRKRSLFIAEALKERIDRQKQAEMEKILAEGYKANREESIVLSKDFEVSDLENWDDY